MDSKTKTVLGVIAVLSIVSVTALNQDAGASTISDIATALNVFAQGQAELIYQNDRLIEQQDLLLEQTIITNRLLMGDNNIFVAGLTDRYDLLEYQSAGSCVYYDRLEKESHSNTGCPITGLTKEQFISMITGNPEK